MMRRLLPSPPLSVALLVVWMLLNQSLHATTWLSGLFLAVVVPLITRGLRPARTEMSRPGVALRLALHVLADMSASVFSVARLLLTRRSGDLQPRYVRIDLRARDPNALAALAIMMCLTPGTAWCELSRDRTVLMLHLFHEPDEAAFVAMFRTRYERPLMQIFEGEP